MLLAFLLSLGIHSLHSGAITGDVTGFKLDIKPNLHVKEKPKIDMNHLAGKSDSLTSAGMYVPTPKPSVSLDTHNRDSSQNKPTWKRHSTRSLPPKVRIIKSIPSYLVHNTLNASGEGIPKSNTPPTLSHIPEPDRKLSSCNNKIPTNESHSEDKVKPDMTSCEDTLGSNNTEALTSRRISIRHDPDQLDNAPSSHFFDNDTSNAARFSGKWLWGDSFFYITSSLWFITDNNVYIVVKNPRVLVLRVIKCAKNDQMETNLDAP